ncbi:MAG: LysR family transcriptional regulator [Burkholderiaceae bacterium]
MLEASPSALRAFVLVASLRSFSKAAAALGTRQSTISSQIARLEEIVGQPLLERSTRRVALAPAGKRLLPLAEEIVELHTVAAARIHDATLTGAVRFGTTEGLWTSFPLAEALGRFGRSHPEVMLSVHLASAADTERAFRANGLDLCLTADPRDNSNGRLIRRERLRWFGRAPDAQHGMPLPLVETPYESALAAIQEALRQSDDGASKCTLAMRGADLANVDPCDPGRLGRRCAAGRPCRSPGHHPFPG